MQNGSIIQTLDRKSEIDFRVFPDKGFHSGTFLQNHADEQTQLN
jgi:hypothetical protein